jgi:triphosphoribosyl-dephospho-CoA synthase
MARIPTGCHRGGRGWSAAVACILEATAAKPGNVHPAAAFPDLVHADLVAAALAIAPVIDMAAGTPLGRTIRAAVAASRRVVRSNANLGIVLAIAPLAAVPVEPGGLMSAIRSGGVSRLLETVDRQDAADVWQAIATARPGGMGTVDACDLAAPPPDDLVAAMRLAADRDEIARLWTTGFRPLLDGPVTDLLADLRSAPLEEAIVTSFLRQLARRPDTHVARRHGAAVATDVSRRAAAVLAAAAAERRAATTAFDRSLREPTRINPGTTADLIAAALYILVYDGHLTPRDS